VLSPVILELHPIGTLGKMWKPKHSLHSFHSALLFSLILLWVGKDQLPASLDTDQLPSSSSWLLEYHRSPTVGVGMPVVPCTTEQFPTVVASPALVHSFVWRRSILSVAIGPRTLVVSSGGSQYHGRSIDTLYCTSYYRRSIVELPRTPQIQQFLLLLFGYHWPQTVRSLIPFDSLADLHLVSCSLFGLPRSIEVLRFIVNFLFAKSTLACPSSSLNIQALLLPKLNVSVTVLSLL
jgi:hypothetical protein